MQAQDDVTQLLKQIVERLDVLISGQAWHPTQVGAPGWKPFESQIPGSNPGRSIFSLMPGAAFATFAKLKLHERMTF